MEEKIRDYIEKNIIRGTRHISTNTPLFSSGILGSLSYLKLVNYIDSQYQISLYDGLVELTEVDTIEMICKKILQKKSVM